MSHNNHSSETNPNKDEVNLSQVKKQEKEIQKGAHSKEEERRVEKQGEESKKKEEKLSWLDKIFENFRSCRGD